MVEWILNLAVGFMSSNPYFGTFVMFVGILRISIKPLMAIIEKIVAETSTKEDDKVVEDVKKSPIYSGILFVLDWFASVKIPKK